MSSYKTLYILQGIPGSGKSTLAKQIRSSTAGVILSTDDYWYEINDVMNGVWHSGEFYNFDITKLGDAHEWNQQRAIDSMRAGTPVVIIDNTNIKKKDIEKYLSMAVLFDYAVQIVSVQVPVEVAIQRQKERPQDRQIPEDVIRRMHANMERLDGT